MKINYLDFLRLESFFDKISAHFITKKNATQLLNQKVDKESGKILSDNNYSTEEKNKLTKLNFQKLVSSCEISGYTITFKDIDDNTIDSFEIPQPTFSIENGELFVSY